MTDEMPLHCLACWAPAKLQDACITCPDCGMVYSVLPEVCGTADPGTVLLGKYQKLDSDDQAHVDSFIDYGYEFSSWKDMPDDVRGDAKYARWVLNQMRAPATFRFALSEYYKSHTLFCLYEGGIYRVTGASRMGDVWLAQNHSRESGYDHRVLWHQCSYWARTPDAIEALLEAENGC